MALIQKNWNSLCINTSDSDRNLLIMEMLKFGDGSEFHLLLYVGTC